MTQEKNERNIICAAPFFYVANIVKSAEHYRDKLGFGFDRFWGDPQSFCMPERDGFTVMLSRIDDPKDIRPNGMVPKSKDNWDAYFWIRDADALFDEFEKNGVEVVYEPKIIELYTMKEFAVRDLDGYVLAFGQDWPAAAKP